MVIFDEKRMSDSTHPPVPADPYLLADHLALDLLNTEVSRNGQRYEFWRSADDVFRWLERCGIENPGRGELRDHEAFLRAAKELRATARALIEARKHEELADPRGLNVFLAALRSVPQLEWEDGKPRLTRSLCEPSPMAMLGTVAEAVATLLAQGDFSLVRQCEHPDCMMWFYDRTKSHRRRWCSMALCGNRHKAAVFRQRTARGAV